MTTDRRDGLEVLLVHRPKYDDWAFPKGKVAAGESDEACALREVEEETGLACELGAELATTRYADRNGREKAVRYWHMRPIAGTFRPSDEVDAVEWLPLARAAERLSYRRDVAVLDSLLALLRKVTVFLVRHGAAGARRRWHGPDRLRPLDGRGRRQAHGLVELIAPRSPARVLSSGYVRCRQTVEPLAAALGLEIEERAELEEGALRADVLALARGLEGDDAVFCTHGDVVEGTVGTESEKGSTWVLAVAGDAITRIGFLPPPD